MKFKALCNFKSSEFAGTQYVKDGVYTIRDGNYKLKQMCAKWLEAKRFIPAETFTVLGITFEANIESYVLPGDDLEVIINDKVQSGKASYTSVGLITFDVIVPDGGVSGVATKQIAGV